MWRLSLVLASCVALSAASPNPCKVDFGNATFDVSPLKSSGSYEVMDDRHNSYSNNYTYVFNICGNVRTIPDAEHCTETYNHDHTTNNGSSPAFQVANPIKGSWEPPLNERCHRLGRDVTLAGGAEEWKLYRPSNPSRGVSLSYVGGDTCSDSTARSLTIHLLCVDDTTNLPDRETVQETDQCHYEIFLPSAFGCPAECPVASRSVCGGHGFCDFDTSRGQPKCFCNRGWSGDDCSTQIDDGNQGISSTAIVLIVVSVLLALLLGFLFFLWTRIRGLRLDPAAYRTLTAGPIEEETEIYDD